MPSTPRSAILLASAVFLAAACGSPDAAPSDPGSGGANGSATNTTVRAAGNPAVSTATTPPTPLTAKKMSWSLDKGWSRAVVLTDGHELLVFSGLNSAKQSLSRVVHIDPTTGKMKDEPKLPHIWHDAAGAWLGDMALLIGGGEQNAATNEVTAVTGANAGKVIGHITDSRSDLSAVTVGDTVYVLGGFDEKKILNTVLASTDGVSFHSIAEMNPPVRYGATVAANGKIFVFGGKTDKGQTDTVQTIDPATGKVETVAHFAKPLGHAFAFVLGGSIYIAGGSVGDATVTATAQIWAFDPASNAITAAGTLPYAVADGGVGVVNDHAYLVGGENNSGNVLNTVIELTR